MMDYCFVGGDQSLAPRRGANQNLVHKTHHIPCLGATSSAPLSGPENLDPVRKPQLSSVLPNFVVDWRLFLGGA